MLKGQVLYSKPSGSKVIFDEIKNDVIYAHVESGGYQYDSKPITGILAKGYWNEVYISTDVELIEKHLPGGHDQKDHGSWATGGGEGYLSRSTEKEIAETISLLEELMPGKDVRYIINGPSMHTEDDWDKMYAKLWKRYQDAGMGKNTAMLQAEIDLGRVSYSLSLEEGKSRWEENRKRYEAAAANPEDEWHEGAQDAVDALDYGLSTATTKITGALKDGQVTMAATESVFESILDDGKYKNQFETRTSNGTLDTGIRKAGEGKGLGIPAGTKLAERPVYGFITTNESTISMQSIYDARSAQEAAGVPWLERTKSEIDTRWNSILSVNNYEADQYGEIRFTLKPDVHSRTTVTVGDSLRAGTLADNMTNPTPNLFHMGIYKQGAPEHTAAAPIARYVEAQIHGGVKVSDISHIYAPADKVESVESMLRARGINIPVSPRAGS